MKKIFTLSILNVFTVLVAYSQTQFQKDYEAVRTELVTWDAVRGEWLANSFEAMANKQSIPDRTFPEDLTPKELYNLVPKNTKQSIQTIVINNSNRATEHSQKDAWKKIAVMTESGLCKPVSARSYGDPHLSSFDGASFSFQTVGEFIMTKSQSGYMEVQSRQKASGSNVSLNSALAMNVAGDRFCVYPNEKPDNVNSTPFRLNGNPISLTEKTYNLPHGGTIVKSGRNDYVVNWPTGERVIFDIRNSSQFDFINLQIEILPCLDEHFDGVLGNANGILSDDFKTSTGRNPQGNFVSYVSFGNDDANRIAREVERQHLAYLAQDFADEWRVNNENTLFDYGFGQNTLSFTDRSFPRVHQTIDDLNEDQRATARRSCEEAGIRGADLNGCIYDRGFLNIPANPRPVVVDRSEGVVLTKIDRPVKADSDPVSRPEKTTPTEVLDDKISPVNKNNGREEAKPVRRGEDNEKPAEIRVRKPVKEQTESTPEKKPVEKITFPTSKKTEDQPKSTPVSTPKTTPVAAPVVKQPTPVSAPKSTPVSTPVVKPPTPVSTPAVKKGKG